MVVKSKNNPFSGIIVGILFVIVGTILLWWNEGNNVANIKSVKDVSENVINVSSDNVDSSNDGKLIATNGNLVVSDSSVDDYSFSIGVKTPVLRRVVEMYQWDEEQDTDSNDNTVYNYNKKWSSNIIDSSNYNTPGHENPSYMPYESQKFYASSVSVGAYNLTDDQIKELSTNKTLVPSSLISLPSGYQISGNYITNSSNLNSPEVGDIRISWEYNNYTAASVLAVQQGNTFVDYVSSSGKTVNRVEEGILTSDKMIQNMQDENNTTKWIFRVMGIVLIAFGYMLFISPLTNLVSFVPILGNIVGSALNLISLLIGLIHAFIIIIIAWIRFRPVIGICLLIVCVGLIFVIKKLIKKNTAKGQVDHSVVNSNTDLNQGINNNVNLDTNSINNSLNNNINATNSNINDSSISNNSNSIDNTNSVNNNTNNTNNFIDNTNNVNNGMNNSIDNINNGNNNNLN